MRTRRAATVAAAASMLALLPAGTAGARGHVDGFSAFDQRLLSDINAARADRGVAPLQLNGQLEPVAYHWAQHVASTGEVTDDPHFGRTMTNACPGWRHVGEGAGSIGRGTADQLFASYMRDVTQRRTLLSRKFRVVGVSTVVTEEDGSPTFWNAIELADRCGG